MPNRCESCNKFTALEFQEPEEGLYEGTLEDKVAASEMDDA